MRHRERMRTPIRIGVPDGAGVIGVTSTAVGKNTRRLEKREGDLAKREGKELGEYAPGLRQASMSN